MGPIGIRERQIEAEYASISYWQADNIESSIAIDIGMGGWDSLAGRLVAAVGNGLGKSDTRDRDKNDKQRALDLHDSDQSLSCPSK